MPHLRVQLKIFALSLVLLMSACSVVFQKDIPDDFDLMGNSENGVVVGSISSFPQEHWQEMSQYFYHSLSNKKIHGVFTSAAKYNPYTVFSHVPKCEDDGLESECGRLFATTLPAGDYEIYAVHVSLDETKRRWEGRVLLGFVFKVKQGQVTYIGNMKSSIRVGAVTFSRADVVSATGMVVDEFERDVPLLRLRFPGLVGWNIERRVLIGDTWEWLRSNKGSDEVTFY